MAVYNAHRTLPAPALRPPTLRRMCHLRSAGLRPQGLLRLQFQDRLCIRTLRVRPLIMTRFSRKVCHLVANLGAPTEPLHDGLQTRVYGFRVQGSDVLGGTQPTSFLDPENKAIQRLTMHPAHAGRVHIHS